MLVEKEIIELLKRSLEKYILHLCSGSLGYITDEAEIKSYLNVLNRKELEVKYLNIDKARELLNRI